ncbi:uncharacterized protein KY384_004933 [Bacidia gigantensis]|uniref:uncharacterized protein n=1 Tax=Bacidia gigantensis TaxID=2732470 RepID=UPI001D038ADF|nr:uncharacterized protein KY384_004933 [Bacidia gigantensis]KAG8530431.1 hypothetical protein KY384_004933 [Bacidia gigantensis]
MVIRRRIAVLFLAALLALLLLNWFHPRSKTSESPTGFEIELITFWGNFSVALKDAAPPVPLPNKHVEAMINPYDGRNRAMFNHRQDLIDLSDEHVQLLRASHTQYVEIARELAPKLPYQQGSKGIAVTASGEWVPELVVSLKILRNSGSTLPVEVFIEFPEVYEPSICSIVLPSLNARCILFSSILNSTHSNFTVSKYQLKPFALLFSTFDSVLLLDADNLAVQPPEDLMTAAPFNTTGLIIWPDYWANTASPLFFSIASIPTISSAGDRASTDSGQVLLSKSKHALTLLLIAYYNVYGPSHYYPLLSQGAVGQGDKETYLAAAMALNAPFYDVKTPILQLGFHPKGPGVAKMQHNAPTIGGKHASASTQHDPRGSLRARI